MCFVKKNHKPGVYFHFGVNFCLLQIFELNGSNVGVQVIGIQFLQLSSFLQLEIMLSSFHRQTYFLSKPVGIYFLRFHGVYNVAL